MLFHRPASPARRLVHLLLWLALIAPLAFQVVPAQGEGQATLDKFLYVPLVLKYASGMLWGLVTDHGAPASGVTIDLWFYDGSSWSNPAITTTNASGRYEFAGPPGLAAGQKYGVEFYNLTDPSRLYFWDTLDLTAYTANTVVNSGDFDIADIDLLAPSAGSTVALPNTFQWTARGVAGDSYEFDLYDYDTGNPWFYTALLGPVGSYALNSLPPGFALLTDYVWGVWVYGPQGYGASYSVYVVRFSSAGTGVVERSPAGDRLPALAGPKSGQPRALPTAEPGQ